MNGFQNPFLNPYGFQSQYQQIPQPMMMQQVQPQTQVTRVNGENGAKAYQIGANSSALLLDESGTMVWLVTSDGAGYKSVSAYDIVPHQVAPAPDFGSLENRIQKLEEIVDGYSRNLNAVSKKQSDDRTGKTDDGPVKNGSKSGGNA